MYTRNVSMKLKVNSAKEFTQTLENEVIPVLRKQKGFKDEITLIGLQDLLIFLAVVSFRVFFSIPQTNRYCIVTFRGGTTDSSVPHFTTATTKATSAINPTAAPVTAKILRDFCIV